jgi:hypothetical protein
MKNDASRIIAGFTAMGLIDDVGTPSAELRKVVSAFETPGWGLALREIIEKAYPFVPDNLEDMTNQQLHEIFVGYVGRDAESMRNVETFFLCLASDAGLPMSEPFLKRALRGVGDAKHWLRLAEFDSRDERVDTSADTLLADKSVPSIDRTARFADQIVKLTSLLSEGDMTDAEKSAVVTVLSYLGRRMNAA